MASRLDSVAVDMSDFKIVTSEQPEIIRRALETTRKSSNGSNSSASDSASSSAKAKSGEGSDPSEEAEAADDSGADDSTEDNDGSGEDTETEDSETDADADTDADDEDDDQEVDQDDDEDSEAEDSGKAQAKKPKSKRSRGIEHRFQNLSTKLAKAEQTIAELKAAKATEAAEAQTQATKAETRQAEKVADVTAAVEEFVAKPAPKMDDTDTKGNAKYPSYGDFVEATAAWAREAVKDAATHSEKRAAKLVQDAVKQMESKFEADQARKQDDNAAQKALSEYSARKSLAEKNPVFKSEFKKFVTENVNDVKISDTAKRVILLEELGPQVQLYLAKHPKLTASINQLIPFKQSLEFGKIIAKLSATASKPATSNNSDETTVKKSVSSKPLPRRAMAGGRGSGGPMSYRNASQLSGDDYMAARKAGTIK